MYIELTDDAYRVLCGLVQPDAEIDSETITVKAETWAEIWAAFPQTDYRKDD